VENDFDRVEVEISVAEVFDIAIMLKVDGILLCVKIVMYSV
jgi:hypothetical protein